MFAGKRALIEVDASNEKRWLASVSVEAIDEIGGVEAPPARFLRVSPGTTAESSYGFEAPRRGVFELGSISVRTRYPFGLIEKGYTVFQPDEVVVYPRLLDDVMTPPTQPVPGDAAPMHRTGRGSEFAGSVRFYREGDEARDIHWKRTASRGDLVVREHEQDSSALVTLTIDDALPRDIDDQSAWKDRFELRISEVATVAAAYLAQGVSVQVQTSDRVSPTVVGGTAPDSIWRFLATLKPVEVSPSKRPSRRARGRAA